MAPTTPADPVSPGRRRVGILVFPEVEVLDFCGPFEVFSVVRLDEDRRREEPSPYEVRLLARTLDPVVATGGLKVLPDATLDAAGPLDILVVPGGWGTRALLRDDSLIAWIASHGPTTPLIASVCTGAVLLGQAGLLDGREATTHWRAIDWMRSLFPHVTVRDDLRVVDTGPIVTSAGISAGIDMALAIVARHHGDPVARATARHMEYTPTSQ